MITFAGTAGLCVSAEEKSDWMSENSIYLKGEPDMAKRKVLSRGMNLGRHLSYDEISRKSEEQVAELSRLGELGEKFISDKDKLESEKEKAKNAKISEEDKASILEELDAGIKKVQEQYEKDVAAEEQSTQETLESHIESMQETAEELEEQADSLRNIQLDAASTDASAAATAAEVKKQQFEAIKDEYTEKLKQKMEQAEMHRRDIRSRQLSRR